MKSLHPNNIHNKEYELENLKKYCPALGAYIVQKYGKETIEFSDPNAVRELNKALLKAHYNINFWDFSEDNLCPPIPGRADYMHYVKDLIGEAKNVKVLDIGTGATCIYPLLGNAIHDWRFVGTDINADSLTTAQKIIDQNKLNSFIELRYQGDASHILKGILQPEETFTVTICNPPFYKSEEEARGANRRKSRNLGNTAKRNFAGNANELWYKGGEKAFLHTYLYESSLHPKSSAWFTSLVSKKENVESLENSFQKLGGTKFKVIPMHQGNKVTRIVCWSFQTKD